MISMSRALSWFVAVITLFATTTDAASQCLGLGTPETEQACKPLKKASDCMSTIAFQNANMTASCIWHSNQTVRVKDQQKLQSKSGSPLAVTGLNFRDSLCGLTATIEVPKSARSRWGANIRLRGGPTGTKLYSHTVPDIYLSSSGCTVSKGASVKCKVDIIPPEGHALDPEFVENSLTIDFFTSDGKRIKNWMNNQRLGEGEGFDVKTTYAFLKCGVKRNDEPFNRGVPAISDTTWLGTTSYQLYENYDRGYMDLSYRTYKITNSTEATWTFDVLKTVKSRIPKQKLVTFMMKEDDYQTWSKKCIICNPPVEMALKNSYCEGTSCSVKKRFLGSSGEYRIFVGFETVCNAYNDKCYSDAKSPSEVQSDNTKELVNIKVWPKLKLAKSSSRAMPLEYNDQMYIDDWSNRGVFNA